MAQDHYKTLGLARGSSTEEIQKSYRDLARKYHPDLNPDDKTAKKKFQEVQSAFDVLSDEKKRVMYDKYGERAESMGGGPGGNPFGGGPGGNGNTQFDFGDLFGGGGGGRTSGGGGFADMFKQFTGGGGRTPQAQPGQDLEHALTIPFATSITGGEASVSIRRPNGKVEAITVKVPAGIEDAKKIRLRGQGHTSQTGGEPGDLLIKIHVSTHPYFTRRGKHLDVKIPITLAEAAGGGKIDVPTPKGMIVLNIPAGSQSGKRFRIKGHGVTSTTGNNGDLFAEIHLQIPAELSDKDRQQLVKISEKYKQEPRNSIRW